MWPRPRSAKLGKTITHFSLEGVEFSNEKVRMHLTTTYLSTQAALQFKGEKYLTSNRRELGSSSITPASASQATDLVGF